MWELASLNNCNKTSAENGTRQEAQLCRENSASVMEIMPPMPLRYY